ncbi:MAG: FeoA domain-containing protein [Campylobacteraceae bacterium]|jgi:ferrous iron transport protein A|nr:FeoA domain-containing protein [Campylobacteraceae bacterium]
MKNLSDLSLNQKGVVLEVDADEELRLRLFSFGIHEGSEFVVKNFSIKKDTIEIKSGKTLIALRFDEAKKVKIKEIA